MIFLYSEILNDIINFASDIKSTDIHFSVNNKIYFRIDGTLYAIDEIAGSSILFEKYRELSLPLTDDIITNLIRAVLKDNTQIFSTYSTNRNLDISYETGYNRLRVNLYFQKDTHAMAMRILPKNIPTMEEVFCFLQETGKTLKKISSYPHGIILITGSTGSGKSTTLAAVIDYINKNFRKHVITLEDPIEYLHEHKRALITQRELNSDIQSFSAGLRAALREDPDIILVGEMRDRDTIQTALEAARTGHLVFSTLHTNKAIDTIMRIINVFPEEKQNEIRLDLAETLRYIVTQRLVRKTDNGRTVAVETLTINDKIAKYIREKEYYKIAGEPEYKPIEKSISELVLRNIIDIKEAEKNVNDSNLLYSYLNKK